MSQVALLLDRCPELALLIERELLPESHVASFGMDSAVLARLWERALGSPLSELASRPGKEFRSRLVSLAWEMAGGRGEIAPELPGIVEALHLGSLIVDDIEDGSARRRGGSALHLLVGLPLALNAGNWLYFMPGALLSRLKLAEPLELRLRVAIDEAVRNCHYGQALDLSAQVTELRQREVPGVVRATTRLKTGSLTELATLLGAHSAGADEERVRVLGRFGREFGTALQMLDDLTGLTSEKRCHKGHEDLIESRPTWPWSWLAEKVDAVAYVRLRSLAEEVARRELHPEVLSEELRDRVAVHGRASIHGHLQAALSALRAGLGEPRGYSALCEEISRLEQYDG
jgi:geranylgeranyl pyrophosphate synthase